MYNVKNGEDVDKDTVLKDREQISLCLKEDDSVSVRLRQNKVVERSLKIKASIIVIVIYIIFKAIS